MKTSLAAAQRSIARRWRSLARGVRDVGLIAFDVPMLFALRLRRRRRPDGRVQVAIFNMHGAGDLLLSLPCLNRLRQAFPADRHELTLFCGPSAMELAALYAPVDHLVVVNRHRLMRSFPYRLSVMKMIVDGRFTIALQPTFNRMLAIEDSLVRAAGAREAFGSAGSPMFIGRLARWLGDRWYHHLVEPSQGVVHELDRYAEFLAVLGWYLSDIQPLALTAPPGPPPTDLVDFILVIPDASSPLKSWPMANFEGLAHQLAERTKAPIIFAGARGAKQPRDEFVRWREGRFVDLTGQTGTAEFLRLIAGARLIVTNDSAGLHLGVALGRPVIAVAGGGLPRRYHPYPSGASEIRLRIVENRLPCYGCNWKCIYPLAPGAPAYCVESVTVGQVLEAVLDMEREIPAMPPSQIVLAARV